MKTLLMPRGFGKNLRCKNMGDFHDLYLLSDVLLLADVMESFRKLCEKHYELDPAHFFTTPGLAWDAMLKMTDKWSWNCWGMLISC